MSLEEALAAHAAALEEHTAAILRVLPLPGKTIAEATAEPVKAVGRPKKVAESTAATPTVTMKQVADLIVGIANDYTREDATSILAQFGAAKCSDLKADQLPDVFKAATEKLAALKAAAVQPKVADSLV